MAAFVCMAACLPVCMYVPGCMRVIYVRQPACMCGWMGGCYSMYVCTVCMYKWCNSTLQYV